MKKILCAIAILLVAFAATSSKAAPAATAVGPFNNPGLACYVDTFAYDQLVRDYCGAVWTPSKGRTPSVAFFEVVGMDTSVFHTYTWSRPACGTGPTCTVPIRAIPEQMITLSVTVRNLIGQTQVFTATAEYINGWN